MLYRNYCLDDKLILMLVKKILLNGKTTSCKSLIDVFHLQMINYLSLNNGLSPKKVYA